MAVAAVEVSAWSELPADPHGCPSPQYFVNRVRRLWTRAPCRQRRCRYCGLKFWKPFKRAQFFAGLRGVPPEEIKLISLTAPGSGVDRDSWNADAPGCFARFWCRLLRAYPGLSLSFFKVAEDQRRGLIHHHIVVRGARFLAWQVVRRCAMASGYGPGSDVRACEVAKGGVAGLAKYLLGDYVMKSVLDWSHDGQHVVTHSHDWMLDWAPSHRVGAGAASGWERVSVTEWWRVCGAEHYRARVCPDYRVRAPDG